MFAGLKKPGERADIISYIEQACSSWSYSVLGNIKITNLLTWTVKKMLVLCTYIIILFQVCSKKTWLFNLL